MAIKNMMDNENVEGCAPLNNDFRFVSKEKQDSHAVFLKEKSMGKTFAKFMRGFKIFIDLKVKRKKMVMEKNHCENIRHQSIYPFIRRLYDVKGNPYYAEFVAEDINEWFPVAEHSLNWGREKKPDGSFISPYEINIEKSSIKDREDQEEYAITELDRRIAEAKKRTSERLVTETQSVPEVPEESNEESNEGVKDPDG